MFPVAITIIYVVASAMLAIVHSVLYWKMPGRLSYIALWSCVLAVIATAMLFSAICELSNMALFVTLLQANAVVVLLVYIWNLLQKHTNRVLSIIVILSLSIGAVALMPTFWVLQIVILGFGGGTCSSTSLLFWKMKPAISNTGYIIKPESPLRDLEITSEEMPLVELLSSFDIPCLLIWSGW